VTVPARRHLAALLALAAFGAGACNGAGGDPAAPADGSTLTATWVDPSGSGTLERGPGEALRDRTDLAGVARAGRTLGSAAVLTDVHVRDVESPARVPFLDRLGVPFSSTFRPQEALSARVLVQAVRAIDAARPDAVVVTGDLIDNAQANELRMAATALNGGVVHPASGGPRYEGPQAASNPDPAYYRPDVDPPVEPGLLARAQRPVRSPGLSAPWHAVPGNHDLLVAGEIARTARTNAVAVGDRMVVAPDPRLPIPRSEAGLSRTGIDRLLAAGLPGRSVKVTPDPGRRELSPAAAVAGLRRASGHGGRGARMDDTFDIGPGVRAIALDTVRRTAGSGGVVTPAQARWVARALAAAGNRWVLVFSHQPLTTAAGGERVLRLLDRDPHVLAILAGDKHRNQIAARPTPAGGYWIVQTAALADFPQQARMLRVRATAGGGAVLETWMLDTAPDPAGADVARRLAYLDAQGGRPDHEAGRATDRNVRLFKARPF
jgi:3',5'-cyclic AMP phosphodiesterase CpdA